MIETVRELKGKIPEFLYSELEYQVESNGDKDLIKELLDEAIAFIEDSQPGVRTVKRGRDAVVTLNDEETIIENVERTFTLLSEPSDYPFEAGYEDVIQGVHPFHTDDALEAKGRIIEPISLDLCPDFFTSPELGKTIGVDIGHQGDDRTCLYVQHGGHGIDCRVFWKQDITQTTGRVIEAIHDHRPDEVICDATGLGVGLIDGLIEHEVDAITVVTGIHFNGRPRESRHNALNQRAEMFILLAEKLRLGVISIPPIRDLLQELVWMKFKIDPASGKIRIEDKDHFKKRNKRSSDLADACALAHYGSAKIEVW